MDGWVVAGGADVRYSDTNGVTLDKYSLDVYTKTGAWASVLTLNLLDPNNAAVLAAFRANTKISADITHLVLDWPVDDIPPWNGTHLIINCGGDGWSLWQDLGYQAGWSQNNGDRTDTATWDYSPYLEPDPVRARSPGARSKSSSTRTAPTTPAGCGSTSTT